MLSLCSEKESQRIAGKNPSTIIFNGALNFKEASKVFFTKTIPRTQHIADISFSGKVHNNKMERMNGEVRDREKTMRGIKTMDTPILERIPDIP